MNLNFISAKPAKVFLTIALILCTTGGVFAQKESVTLSRSQMTGAEIFDEIQAQTPVTIGYDKTVFDSSKSFTLTKTRNTVEAILEEMFRDTPVTYKFQGKLAFLSPRQTSAPATARRNPAARPARTNDVYVFQPEDSVSAAPVPRPQVEKPAPRPVTVEVVKPREFPVSSLPYTPVINYTQSYKSHPSFAIKTNVLYGAAALTPNLGVEFGIGPASTLSLSGSYTWYNREKKTESDTKQFVHSVFSAEYRYWFCERFNGWFIGGHALYSRYNISGHKVPLLFDKEYRYDGHAYGAGVSGGYHWAFARRWGVEFNIGVGYAYMKYDKFDCEVCDRDATGKTKNYFGPTKLGVTLVFLIK